MKNKTLKRAGQVLSVTLAAVILTAALGFASAEEGRVAYNQIGVRLFDRQQVKAGETYRAPNGQDVPSSITYIDAAGGKTNYLSVRRIAELLDAELRWDGSSNSVDIAASGSGGNVTVSVGVLDESGTMDDLDQKAGAPREYGQTAGPFEEIDPDELNGLGDREEAQTVYYLKDVRLQSETFSIPSFPVTAVPERGQYLVYTVKNNGDGWMNTVVFRRVTISGGSVEKFPGVPVGPGETLVRVFRVSEGENPLKYSLNFGVSGDGDTDVTVSLAQFPA